MKLVNIEAALADVAKVKPGERLKLINEYLRGTADWRTTGGRALMARRAEFVTELRKKGLWGA